MPAPQYVSSASGMQKGVLSHEGGIKIDSIDWTINDPKEYCYDIYGGNDGFCHGFNPSIEISVTGEVNAQSGVSVAAFGTAITFLNEDNCCIGDPKTFAGIANSGGFYPESISFSESRDGFKTITLDTISHPSIT